jgi:hypothetical protein
MRTTLLSLPTALRTDLQSKGSMILADGLSNDLAPLLAGARLPMAMLAAEPEPLAAINDLLSRARHQGTPITTLHLVAHGRSGAVRFGNRWITTASLVAPLANSPSGTWSASPCGAATPAVIPPSRPPSPSSPVPKCSPARS